MSLRGEPDLVSKLRGVIAKVKPLLEKATPRPWEANHYEFDWSKWFLEHRNHPRFPNAKPSIAAMNTPCVLYSNAENDAALIVVAVSAMDELESLLGLEGQAAQEALCGTAGSATISTNEAGRRTAMDVSPSEELLSRPHRIVSHEQMESVLNAPEPNVTVNPDGSCSPSTPIVPGTPDDPRFNGVVVEVAEEFAILEGDIPRLRGILGRIRKSVLEEAAQLLKYYGHSANLVDDIRALAERPAPAGEARISRWQCPHCAHVNSMISANCENCKIPLVNTAR